jgi:hypothetical protein
METKRKESLKAEMKNILSKDFNITSSKVNS